MKGHRTVGRLAIREGEREMSVAVEYEPINEVRLVGRLGARVEERALPSGDVWTSFSVTVDREAAMRWGSVNVDSIACVVRTARLRRTVESLSPGQWVEVTGSVHRRFWRSGTGLGSVTEVHVGALEVLPTE